MATTLKSHLRQNFETSAGFYARDLDSMSHEMLDASCGGASRAGYDFTYEVVLIHRRIEARLTGRDPGAYPGANGWIVAPPEFRNKETAIGELKESSASMLKAYDAVDESDLEKEITIPNGKTSPLDLMSLAVVHINYHDAQLNYIQAIHGDASMHWQD